MKIAAVVPCYNSASTIEETLRSIAGQSLPCHEIIVVDDGSSDGTEAKVRLIDGVKYYRQKNAGPSVARNKGVEIAESDWIAFCDADDLWHANKVEILAECIAGNPDLSFIYHDFFLFTGNHGVIQRETRSSMSTFPFFLENRINLGKMFREARKVPLHRSYEGKVYGDIYVGNVFKWLILGNFILPTTTVMRRDAFLESKGFDTVFRLAEDAEFFLRLSKQTIFGYLDLQLAGYRKSLQSATGLTSNRLSLLQAAQKALMKNCVYDQSVYKRFRKTIDLSISRRHARISYLHLSELRTTEAMKAALDSIRYCPMQGRGWLHLAASMAPIFLLSAVRRAKAKKPTG